MMSKKYDWHCNEDVSVEEFFTEEELKEIEDLNNEFEKLADLEDEILLNV